MNSVLDFSTVVDSETVSPFSDEDTTIQFTKYLDNRKFITITHEQLDKWKHDNFFKYGFYEYFKDSTYRRLYFDFDDMQNENDFEEVLSFLDSLTPVCGNYAYAGTTTDSDIAELYDLTYIDEDDYNAKYPTLQELAVASGIKDFNLTTYMNAYYKKNHKLLENTKPKHLHAISIHAVFYEVCCNPNAMRKILNNSKFIKENTNQNIKYDTAVYANVGEDKTFRHVCAPKLFKYDVSSIKLNQADVPTCFKASQLCVTCDGSERILQMSDLRKAIPIVLTSTPKRGALHEVERAKPKIVMSESIKEMICEEIEIAKYEGNTKEVEKLQKQLDDADKVETYVTVEEYTDEDFELPECGNTFVTPELLQAFTKCLLDMKEPIHSYPKQCKVKPSTVPIFSGYFACMNDNINESMIMAEISKLISKGTPNAQDVWYERASWSKKSYTLNSIGCLISTCKYWNLEGFNRDVKPLLPKRKRVIEVTCDISDKFCAADVTIKAENHEYQEIDALKKFAHYDYLEPSPFIFNYEDSLNDLKRCMVVINKAVKTFYFKELDGFTNTYNMVEYKQSDAMKYLGDMILGTEYKYTKKNAEVNVDLRAVLPKLYKEKSPSFDINELKLIYKTKISALEMYLSHQSLFSYKAVTFYSTNPEVYSIFKGYKYNQTEVYDMELIQPFINFVHDVIANGRDDVVKYLHAWFQSILKNPTYKTGVAIILKGKQGTGKNTFTDALCALLGDYAMPNVANVDNLTGRFNSSIINKKIIVVNELKSAENHAIGTADVLKTLITDYYMNLEQKCVDVKTNVVQVANFIINTNNIKPLTISEDDRRMCVLTPNPKYKNNKEYFLELRKTMFVNPNASDSAYRDDFMQALISYYWYTDFGIKPEALRNIPQTDERKDLIDISRPFTFNFIAKHIDEYTSEKGIVVDIAYQKYLNYFNERGYGKKLNSTEFYNIMKNEYCTRHQIRLNGQRPYAWKLNEELNVFKELKEANERLLAPLNIDLDEEETPEEKRERLNAALAKMQEEMKKLQDEIDAIPTKQ